MLTASPIAAPFVVACAPGARSGDFGSGLSATRPLSANCRRGALYGAFLGLLVLLAGCTDREASEARPASAPVDVAVARVSLQPIAVVRSLAGTIRPTDRATVAARTMGIVEKADLILGQSVSSGQVMLTLFAPEVMARRDQALASLEQAKRELARETSLAGTGASTTDALRTATDRMRIATAALKEAEALVERTNVTAPFAGVLTRQLAYAGDVVQPGTPLFEVEARDNLRVELQVPEALPVPNRGTTINVDLGQDVSTGVVDEVSPAADPVTHTREARIRLAANGAVRSGQFVRVEWPAGNSEGLVIPTACLRRFGQVESVFVVRDGRAELRLVRPGPATGETMQILSGVSDREVIIVAPPPTLRDGDVVRLRP